MAALEEGKKVSFDKKEYFYKSDDQIKHSKHLMCDFSMSFMLDDRWEIFQEPQEELWQWRYKVDGGPWAIDSQLLTSKLADEWFAHPHEIHAGPFKPGEK